MDCPMKQHLKTWFPLIYGSLSAWKNALALRVKLWQVHRESRRLDQLVLDDLAATVMSGPFRGMRYIRDWVGVACKVIGTYERELHPLIAELLTAPYKRVVNVGSAEGY